jgi:glycerol kinase
MTRMIYGQSTAGTCRTAIVQAGLGPADIVAIGITNQRKTTIARKRKTGDPIYRTIVY